MATLGREVVRRMGGLGTRGFSRSSVVPQHFQQQGIPGSTLPFGTSNKYKVTLGFVVFFMSGLTAPWLVVWHQMRKASAAS